MEYHEAASFLFDLRRFQVKPGTAAVRSLLEELGDPHEGVTFVQVAGSNGKGSTSRMVESILREAGLTVGLYTSPHLDNVRERIRVDGRMIPESSLVAFVERARPFLLERAAEGEPLTFFETVTAMGLWEFGRADVDVAVLEVGMGGALDATSVVDPAAAAVTNVELEHTRVLGNSIEEIATTKADVAPDDAPLVTAATGEALSVLRRHASDVVTVRTAHGDDGDGSENDGVDDGRKDPEDADVTVSYAGRVGHDEAAISLAGEDWAIDGRLPLLGEHQARNAGVAAALTRQLAGEDGPLAPVIDGPLSTATIARGLRGAHWPGRFEVLEHDPLVIIDGAHNPPACVRAAETLSEFDYEGLHLVFAAMHEKDHRGMVRALPAARSVTTCRPDLNRAEDPEVLAQVFERAAASAEEPLEADAIEAGDSVADALRSAHARAGPNDCVLVVGSLFAVAEARRTRTRLSVPKHVETEGDAADVLADAHVPAAEAAPAIDDAVHHVVKTRLEGRQADKVRESLLAAGGTCAISGARNRGELIDVVMMGTREQFDRLLADLVDAPFGLSDVRAEIHSVLASANRTRPGRGGPTGETTGVAGSASDGDSGRWPWEDRTAVMGILNVTPDSFHDGGEYVAVEDAIARAEAMVDAGADVIDIGGESTRPGADPVAIEQELARIEPVIEAVSDLDVLLSVDTRRAEVARAALDAGADILNDVSGLADPEMRFLAADRGVPIVVMHSVEAPVDPETDVTYDDVVEDVIGELRERVLLAERAGVPREHVIVDPGLGFAKDRRENFELLGRLEEFAALGCPVLVGHSHKSMFDLIAPDSEDHLAGTVAGSALAAEHGADIVRVHDVAENVAAVRAAEAAADPDAFDLE
jgi:dihydropteroate synthase